MAARLFHVSEEAGIRQFEPRPPPSSDSGVVGDCVWAVDEAHLANFLAPRDCPRIAFAAGPATTAADRERFLIGATRVIAIEWGWFERLRGARLVIYEMPGELFEPALPEAGYWISRHAVTPTGAIMESDLLAALRVRGVDLRLLDDFWSLADAVAASTLEFSIIRSRNAARRSGAAMGDRRPSGD